MQRFTFKSLLHVYIAHISCLRTVKIKLSHFMDSAEITLQTNLLDKLHSLAQKNAAQTIDTSDKRTDDQKHLDQHIYKLSENVYS